MTPGTIPGFSDVLFPYPFITNYAITANYMVSPTMFLEGTYGFIRNELTGGNENGITVNDSANRLNGVRISDPATTNNHVEGNQIGTDASGFTARPNFNNGVLIQLGASGNYVGELNPQAIGHFADSVADALAGARQR